MGANSSKHDLQSAQTVVSAYESACKDVEANERLTSSSNATARSRAITEEMCMIADAYKKGSFDRVVYKGCTAGVAGLVLGPIFSAGAFPFAAAAGACNAAGFVVFYDVLREAMTSITLSDTPIMSGCAGAVSGYLWNAIVHQRKIKALAGATAVGGIASVIHAAMPSFEADKVITAVALDMDLLADPNGSRRAFVKSAPVLTPFDLSAVKSYLGNLACHVVPFRRISDEEYQEMLQQGKVAVRDCSDVKAKS